MSFFLILADSELEALPGRAGAAELPRVCSTTAKGLEGIHVLDSYLHREIVEGLEGSERRGRPDIVHSFLVLALNSRQAREGQLGVFVHTRGDEVIRFGKKARVDQNYLAFLGMMGRLLDEGGIGEGEERVTMEERMTLKALLQEIGPDLAIAMSPSGERLSLADALHDNAGKKVAIIIGGFPEGDFRSPVYGIADMVISLGDELLTVPDVTAQVLSGIP